MPAPKTRAPKRKRAPWALLAVIAALVAAASVHHKAHQRQVKVDQYWSTPAKLSAPPLVVLPKTPVVTRLPFPIGENSGVLWNLNNGQLLWAMDPHLREPYASTTKLMTIYLALHQLPLSQVVSISPRAAATPGSDIKMAVGNRFTVKQLLYALMLRSANDSAVALAQADQGHVAKFVAEMNQTAQSLGMQGTTYGDPDGLNPHSAGTAWDLSIIARQDMQNPLFRQIVRTKSTSLPYNPVVTNLNGLLYLDPTVIGVKTGWTGAAGFNLVFAATRQVNGQPVTLLGVIMHGQHGFPPEYQDAEKILNWGFKTVKGAPTTAP
ncbi:D-alanyl-D-alanine carboxypeptidase [Sulfobacillus sp. DSM 109850]|uniref:D-alanyl-D-alanine carboxypeptidase n=1 Tax=Sulfobacillus harzensis TaxID=2729629 RepID=A0A7Y0L1J8_9FIRM|nr:serine hydrolase [Sulfobacillus harzensis]NMP21056.1 D-alanyl-D-alanine carboxypeptidase [Sulfobacillus harzensis]